jgi:tetratricopeptide (TPR) repeat protein
MRKFDRAIADLTEAIRLAPGAVAWRLGRGDANFEKGDLDHAIVDFTDAIRLAPTSPVAFDERGRAYERKGEGLKAKEDFAQAKKLLGNAQRGRNAGK